MTILICGSRTITASDFVRAWLDRRFAGHQLRVIAGGARGADELGAAWARSRGHQLQVIPADWRRYGRSAGMRRNTEMLSHLDTSALVVAFVPASGVTSGTADTIRKARAAGIAVEVVSVPGPGQVGLFD